MEYFTLNNIKISDTKPERLKNIIRERINSDKSAQFITFNLDFLYNSVKNIDFKNICLDSEFVFADGFGITSLVYLKYGKKISRITGNDLFPAILEILNENSASVAFTGASKKVMDKLKKKISDEYKNVKVVAALSPPFNFENDNSENSEILKKLCSAKPDVLFLALGSPRQEFWISKYKNEIGAKINIGVGAVFDFYTGNKQRSPLIFQKAGLEWLWRFFNEPVRLFKRYFINDLPLYIKFAFLAIIGKKI